MSPSNTPRRARSACPLCGQPPADPFAPFCSRGCRDRDLLQWLGEGYRVPGRPIEPDADFDPEALDSTRKPLL